MFHNRTSLIEPLAPPSALAPLSDTAMTNVLSRSPSSVMKSSTRPIWASAWDKKPAKHSMKRAATRWSSGASSSQAGTHGGRGDNRVPAGSRPICS